MNDNAYRLTAYLATLITLCIMSGCITDTVITCKYIGNGFTRATVPGSSCVYWVKGGAE